METIKLNKKTKVILWKRILLVAAAALIFVFSLQLDFTYKYYAIDVDGNKTILGNSQNSHLIIDVKNDYLTNIESKGYYVIDYTTSDIIDRKIILTWKKDKENNVEKIEKRIEDTMVVMVYAYKLSYKGKSYIIPENKRDYIFDNLDVENKDFESIYVNIEKLLDDEAIENLIAG